MGIRRDVYVYNESTGLIVTSAGLAADARGDDVELGAPGDKAWKKAVQSGLVLPVELVQDDPVVVRVIVGEDLTDEEQAEWVGRLESTLVVDDGRLALCGGLDLLEEGLESADDYVQVLDVPAGTYRATLYAQLPGLNGEHLFGRAAGKRKKAEALGAYFRRTRAKKKFPAWLQAWCVAYPDKDPGHEAEWREKTRPEDGREVVDFVLHLQPLRARQKAEAAKIDKDGFVGLDAWEVRAPEECPLGLAAKRLVRKAERAPREVAPAALPNIESLLQGCELTRLGRVDVPLERLGDVFTLAWFATDSSHPELVIEPAVDLDLRLEDAIVERDRARLRIGTPVTAGKWTALTFVSELGRALARLPDKTVLELRTACPDLGMGERRHQDAGRQRYYGTVKKGVWTIESAYPRLTQSALREALALAAQARDGKALALHSTKEATELLARVMKEDAFLFESNPLTVDGERLVLAEPNDGLLTMVGQRAFRKRYPSMWSVPEEDDDAEDPFADFAAALTKQLAAPASREVLLEGAFSVYRRADLLDLQTVDVDEVQATHRALTDLGFTLLGDLVCEKAGDVVIRGYAQPQDGDAWAVLMVGTLGQGGFDFSSDFASGASLTTTTTPGQKDDKKRKSFKKSFAPATPIDALWRSHRERLAAMTKRFGDPVAVTADLVALAKAIDASLVRQFSS